MLVLISLLLSSSYYFLGGLKIVTYVLSLAQFLILLDVAYGKSVTPVVSFCFMYCLFFAVRPVYILINNDYRLFDFPLYINVGIEQINYTTFAAYLALLSFWIGGILFQKLRYFSKFYRVLIAVALPRRTYSGNISHQKIIVSDWILLLIQSVVIFPLHLLASSAGRSLYSSGLGAYLYDLPIILQAFSIFSFILMFWKYRQRLKSFTAFLSYWPSSLSLFLVLMATYLMRDLSIFRGFYITGLLILFIAFAHSARIKIRFIFLAAPILFLNPFFRLLGESRRFSSTELISRVVDLSSVYFSSLWTFFDSRGDMNIFDTFVAAVQSSYDYYPYFVSWLYVPFHLVPRSLWPSKPVQGITQDLSFLNGSPLSPGISGFFFADGGFLWMLASMFFLGLILSLTISYIRLSHPSPLLSCFYSALIVNSIFLTRFTLWQYFFQVLYFMVPCILMHRLFVRRQRLSPKYIVTV